MVRLVTSALLGTDSHVQLTYLGVSNTLASREPNRYAYAKMTDVDVRIAKFIPVVAFTILKFGSAKSLTSRTNITLDPFLVETNTHHILFYCLIS